MPSENPVTALRQHGIPLREGWEYVNTVAMTEVGNYTKKPVKIDSGNYEILGDSAMWKRYQAAGEYLSGYSVTAFYPLEVHAKNGDVYVIAAELNANTKTNTENMHYTNNTPIKGNILPIPTEHLEDFEAATTGRNACPYYLSVSSRTSVGKTIGAVLSGIMAVLFAVGGVILLKRK